MNSGNVESPAKPRRFGKRLLGLAIGILIAAAFLFREEMTLAWRLQRTAGAAFASAPVNSAKAADLRKFVYWAVTQGQKFGPPLFFVPLPTSVKAFAYRELAKVKAGT